MGEGHPVGGRCAEKERAGEWPDATEWVDRKREEGHVASEEVADDTVAVYSCARVRITFVAAAQLPFLEDL